MFQGAEIWSQSVPPLMEKNCNSSLNNKRELAELKPCNLGLITTYINIYRPPNPHFGDPLFNPHLGDPLFNPYLVDPPVWISSQWVTAPTPCLHWAEERERARDMFNVTYRVYSRLPRWWYLICSRPQIRLAVNTEKRDNEQIKEHQHKRLFLVTRRTMPCKSSPPDKCMVYLVYLHHIGVICPEIYSACLTMHG